MSCQDGGRKKLLSVTGIELISRMIQIPCVCAAASLHSQHSALEGNAAALDLVPIEWFPSSGAAIVIDVDAVLRRSGGMLVDLIPAGVLR